MKATWAIVACLAIVGAALAQTGKAPAEDWTSSDLPTLATMAKDLVAKGGETAEKGRKDLVQVVLARCASDKVAVRAAGAETWRVLAENLIPVLAQEDRTRWAGLLKDAFLENAQAAQGVKFAEMGKIFHLVEALDEREASAFAVRWVETCDTWKEIPPANLRRFTELISWGGEAGRAQMPKVVAYITQEVLANTEAVRAVRYWDWRSMSGGLRDYLDEAARRVWVERLRAALLSPERLAAADAEIIDLREALAAMGDSQADAMVATWMSQSDAWKSANAEKTQMLAADLVRLGDEARGLRRQLIEHITAKQMVPPEGMKSNNCWQWKELAGVLAPDMDGATRKTWIRQLRGTYAGEDLGSLEVGDILALREALETLGDSKALDVVQIFMDSEGSQERLLRQPGAWTALLRDLVRGGDSAKPQRLRVAALVAEKYLASPEAARSLNLRDWCGITEGLKDLDAATRQAWVRKLRGAWMGEKALAALQVEDLVPLKTALTNLGDKNADDVMTTWMAAPGVLDRMSVEKFLNLARTLYQQGDVARTLRADLATYLGRKFLEKPEVTRSVVGWQWREMAEILGKDMDGATRQTWCEKLRGAYTETETLSGLTFRDVMEIRTALAVLGDEKSFDVVGLWMRSNDSWKEFDVAGFQSLAWHLMQAGPQATEDRVRLASYVTDKCLPSPENMRKGTCNEWCNLAGTLRKDMDALLRPVWVRRLREAFADPKVMASMKAVDVMTLADTLKDLGDEKVPNLLALWVLANKRAS